jgi:threonyl-tRNA synthetase
MAQVLEEMYPGIKLTLGPAIANGFYYDVDFEDQKNCQADFKKIEDRVLEISRGKHEFKFVLFQSRSFRTITKTMYTKQITNLEDGNITFCDHDILLIYVVVDIFQIQESSKL